ncbi:MULTISPECIES: hypothetical protein [unclassified Bradyrhizobium]|uniref:hypothetical protein n=1 Tax=Bradyrhizobium sp. USDA 3458 TaxID=2591461 RepID=UPI0011447609|nr:hypothetical protein [Bradyrhizobium sp. USDA 3458]
MLPSASATMAPMLPARRARGARDEFNFPARNIPLFAAFPPLLTGRTDLDTSLSWFRVRLT